MSVQEVTGNIETTQERFAGTTSLLSLAGRDELAIEGFFQARIPTLHRQHQGLLTKVAAVHSTSDQGLLIFSKKERGHQHWLVFFITTCFKRSHD